jgi:hypothetical protein
MAKVTVLTNGSNEIVGVFKKDSDAVKAVPAFRWKEGMEGSNNQTIYVNTQELLGDHSKTNLGKQFEKHMVQWRAQNETVEPSTTDKILMMNESLNDAPTREVLGEAKEKKFFIGDWDGDWDTKYSKKGQWYVINYGDGGPMDRSSIKGFVMAKSEMTEQELRDKLVTHYGTGINKYAYHQLSPVTAGERNKWVKEQQKDIQAINDTIAKSGLKV